MPLPRKAFFLIRHGETEANVAQELCGGGVDTILTALGIQQAQELAKHLQTLPFFPTRIIHSDMNRSRDTANILNKALNLPIHGDNELREHMFGEWEGEYWEDALIKMKQDLKPKGGENRDEFAERVRKNLARVLNEHEDDTLMVVAHGGTFHAFMHIYEFEAVSWIDNCHLHYFEPTEDHPIPWKITAFNVENGKLVAAPSAICPVEHKKKYLEQTPENKEQRRKDIKALAPKPPRP